MIRLSVIVVTFDSEAHIERCLAALCDITEEPAFEVIVSDNRSRDRTTTVVERFAREFSDRVRLQTNATNRGYAGGVNAALPLAAGEYVCVLNPDVVVEPNWLRPLVEFMDSHPEVAAANPLILLDTDRGRINAAGQLIHVSGLGFNRWLGRSRSQIAGQEAIPVAGIQGSAFIIRKSLLDEIGGWDESGFLYHEDVELSWLLRLMGHDLYCVPTAVVSHSYALSMYPEKLYLLERNRWRLLQSHLERSTTLVLLPILVLTECLMWGYCLLRGPRFLRAKLQSVLAAITRRGDLRARRAFVRSLRRRSDWQVFSLLNWRYSWEQFLALGRERGRSIRQPKGGMPPEYRGGE